MNDEKMMKEAIKQALGDVYKRQGKIISRAYNKREKMNQSIAHAEILAIQKACRKLDSWRLDECDLFVTLEPCPMCAGAIIQSRIKRVVFGAYDPKGGSVETCTKLFDVKEYNHHPEYIGGILEPQCSQLLKDFFKEKRKKSKQIK